MGFTIDTKPLVDMLDEIATLRSRIEELERGRITNEMIDKAWAKAKEIIPEEREFVLAVFEELGIVACEECGGSGVEKDDDGNDVGYLVNPAKPYPCPGCHGHGWVRRNDG